MAFSDTDFHRAVYASSQAHMGFGYRLYPSYPPEIRKVIHATHAIEPVWGGAHWEPGPVPE